MREALMGVANADRLETDFYDRTRLATWVRRHPGLITWVKERVGRSVVGWHSYGAWSSATEGVDSEYLLDDKLRLHLGNHRDAPAQPVGDAIDELRDILAQAGKMIRLVGLSGVGKTRLVQALFDARIGSRPLPPSLAVYTNLNDNPAPQPTGLASDLIANRTRAILVVDNCPPDLHRRLSELCSASSSTVSVLTVEYDVRDDQPEGTQVVTLDTSSPELIEQMVTRRYPHLSPVDARTIAEASGGNARIALALASTVERSESIADFSDDELFQRLFRQRHDPNDALLLTAQACALVYSFQGEALTGEEAELPRLGLLANQAPQELFRHVGELLRRDLIQRRSVWRAVLPHAIANRLAARALEDIPYDLINEQLVIGGTEHLARSFSRRLSFLHQHPRAIAIVEQWLAPTGLLGDVTTLSNLGRAMFKNVAPVSPEGTLAALERAESSDRGVATLQWREHRSLLRSLAYDPILFERSCFVLAQAATQSTDDRDAKEISDTFISLFTIHLSGTHATVEQRLGVIERLLRSEEPKRRSLGLTALSKFLTVTHFASLHTFEFGARSRDYGYRPGSDEDVTRWYSAALALIEQLALVEGLLKPELRSLLARSFRGLWARARVLEELENLSLKFAQETFWPEGWLACRQTMHFDTKQISSDSASRLSALEVRLRPTCLSERIQLTVLGDRSSRFDLEYMEPDDDFTSRYKRLEATAYELGVAVAANDSVLTELMPVLLRGGIRVWAFGRGLAGASTDHRAIWSQFLEQLGRLPIEQRNVQMLVGYLAEVSKQDRDLVQEFLDAALDQPVLLPFVPALHFAVGLDARGVDRLKQALNSGGVPIWMYRDLAYGWATDQLPGSDLKDLLLLIMQQPDGFGTALEILSMHFHLESSERRKYESELIQAGQELLRRIEFKKDGERDDYNLAGVARGCLTGPEAGPIAAEVAGKLRQAVAAYETYAFDNGGLLGALLGTQPMAVLDALFEGSKHEDGASPGVFDYMDGHRTNPADQIPAATLIDWCDCDPSARYPIAASFITFARRAEESRPIAWSEQAQALFTHTSDPLSVLTVFIERFQPSSWSGSRATLMEANARLLDDMEGLIPAEYMSVVADAKKQLARNIAGQREWETKRDRDRDERFE
ncbi:hypothetical protein [Rhizobium sp. BR 249]|uniref:hypothetical protein n=1 Tax=Rhizobium sp. BR 249 TaxID=3040011 RepID=UPI0039BFDDB4